MENVLRVARLEHSVVRLKLLVAATSIVACAASATAIVLALRTPTELRIGNTHVHAKGVSIHDGTEEVNIAAGGLYLGRYDAMMAIEPMQVMMTNRNGRSIERPNLLFVVTSDRATVALEGADNTVRMEVGRSGPTVEIDGRPLTPVDR